MRIQCLLGPASTTIGSTTYDFHRDDHGRFVAEVHDLLHVKCLISAGTYAEATNLPEPQAPGTDDDDDNGADDQDDPEGGSDATDGDDQDETDEADQPPEATQPRKRGRPRGKSQ